MHSSEWQSAVSSAGAEPGCLPLVQLLQPQPGLHLMAAPLSGLWGASVKGKLSQFRVCKVLGPL